MKLQNMLNEKELKILEKISTRTVFENKFFKEIIDLKWFYTLKEKGYFNPDRNPLPKEEDNQKGFYLTPYWNVLNYLEKVSQQVSTHENEKYINELLDIIKGVTEYHITNNRITDNYHTWASFIKILVNFPNEKIIEYLKNNNINFKQDWLKEWLTSRLTNALQANEITTKLLPKFLTENKDDINIAEDIIDVIIDMKKDDDKGTFVDLYLLKELFENNSQKIGELCSEKVINNIAERLKKILDKEHEETSIPIELNDDIYNIIANHIMKFDFEIVIEKSNVEDSMFKAFRINKKTTDGGLLHKFIIKDIHNKKTFMQNVKEEILKNNIVSFLNKNKELEIKISRLYRNIYDDASNIWIRSISSFSLKIGYFNTKELFVNILRDILSTKCKIDTNSGIKILENFLSDEYQYSIFRRLAIFIITGSYDKYKNLFWIFFEKNPEIIYEENCRLELYDFFKINVKEFTEQQKKYLNDLINNGPIYILDENKENRIANWKQKWYSAMKEDPCFAKYYEEQKAITKAEKVPPTEEEPIIGVFKAIDISPISKEEMFKMTNIDLVKYLNEFKPKNDYDSPNKDGMANILKEIVKEKPDKFVDDLNLFLDVDYVYIRKILEGVKEAWKEKKDFNWGKLFDFIKKYITLQGFIDKAKEAQGEDWYYGKDLWVINEIAFLIDEGSKNDSWAFKEEYFNQAEEILDIIEKIAKETSKEENNTLREYKNFLTYALNTTYGKFVETTIIFSLRKARFNEKHGIEKDKLWNPQKYEEILNENIVEAYAHMGRYLPNFTYLNNTWLEKKVKEFEQLNINDIQWQAFIEGYFFAGTVLYSLMKNHYKKAIDHDFKDKEIEETFVQHITVGYLRDYEQLEDKTSLFNKIIDKWNYEYFKIIVYYLCSLEDYFVQKTLDKETENIKTKIIEFWRWLYKNDILIKDKLIDNYKNLVAELAKLIVILDKIDKENSEWIKLIAPNIEDFYPSYYFYMYLDKFEDEESIKYIYEILESSSPIVSLYSSQENLISIVKKIYKFCSKEEGNKIINIYASKGYEFLKPIYNENK